MSSKVIPPTIELDDTSRVLIIAPHPDDESLACGGLIQHAVEAGAAVRVLFVTDGDNNRWPQRVLERRWIIRESNRVSWGRRRRNEARAAVRRLGLELADVVFAGFPDGGLTDDLLTGQADFMTALRQEIDDFAPTAVISPSNRDSHADHSAVAVMVRLVVRAMPIGPVLFEYQIHGSATAGESEAIIRLLPEQIEAKREAILCHRTQVALSGRRFLGYANEVERFQTPTVEGGSHPVQELVHDAAGWRIKLAPRRWFDRAAASYLDVVACAGSMIVAKRRVLLAGNFGRHAKPDVLDIATGSCVAAGRYDADNWLILPDSAIPSADQIFVKRQGGIAFFDEAGWKEVALVDAITIVLPEPASLHPEPLPLS